MYEDSGRYADVFSPVSVTDLNDYIQALISNDEPLQAVCVRGEISNFTNHRSGHLYFTLKDEKSLIRTVMFRREASMLPFRPENGMRVIIYGRIDVFKANGQYQLYAAAMEPDGIGSLALLFEQLKKKLEQEGLFDSSRKRKLPPFPRRIGVLTSPTGAAVQDIINIITRRYPLAEIIIYPSLVQGNAAPADIVRGITYFSEKSDVDVLIFGRGGGAPEDLFAFNDETVVRAVAHCRVPTISAVGHETDVTLSDFAADLRAPTPSAAAELVVPNVNELKRRIKELFSSSEISIQKKLTNYRKEIDVFSLSKILRMPQGLIEDKNQMLDRLYEKLEIVGQNYFEQKEYALKSSALALNALSPLSTLSRGYAIVSSEKDNRKRTVGKASSLTSQERISIHFIDGIVYAKTEEVLLPDSQSDIQK